MNRFDAILIGAGQAGPALAGRLTTAGMTVAVIERRLVGGTCVNTGCTPTKTLVASAQAAYTAHRAARRDGARRLVLRTQGLSVEARLVAHPGAQVNGIHEVMGSIPSAPPTPTTT
jgi:pyruvate/2-oxoglutarate dehydrogenase complex dihydrolipoamide dehydrogenase (E3) component